MSITSVSLEPRRVVRSDLVGPADPVEAESDWACVDAKRLRDRDPLGRRPPVGSVSLMMDRRVFFTGPHRSEAGGCHRVVGVAKSPQWRFHYQCNCPDV